MDAEIPTLLVLAILFVSTFTRSTLGFGDALLAMPLLTMVVSIKTATPLVAFTASTIATTILLSSWRKVDVRAVWRLVLSSFVGLPFGIWLVYALPLILLAIFLGGKLNQEIPPGRFDRLVHVLLVLLGALVIARAYLSKFVASVRYNPCRGFVGFVIKKVSGKKGGSLCVSNQNSGQL